MPRPRSDLSPRIREVARRRFLLEGVDGASLRSIAEGAGTTIGMVYYYYPTKDDLFDAVVSEVYDTMLADAAEALRSDAPPDQRLARLYARIAAMSEEEFDVVRLILRELMISSTRLEKLARKAVDGHLPWVLSTLAEGRGNGTFDPALPIPVEMAATMALMMLPQLMLRLVQRSNLDVPYPLPSGADVATMMHGILLHGIQPKTDAK